MKNIHLQDFLDNQKIQPVAAGEKEMPRTKQIDLFGDQPSRATRYKAKPPTPRRVNAEPVSPITERPDGWVPQVGDTLHLVSDGGSVREVELLGFDGKEIKIWLGGIVGARHFWAKSGRLKGKGGQWRLYEPELKVLTRYAK